jgi:hypothetical protein
MTEEYEGTEDESAEGADDAAEDEGTEQESSE